MTAFLPSDLDRVALAVQEAERGTSGEIVPYIVPESDEYAEAIWRAAALGATTALLLMSIAQVLVDFRMRLGIIGVALVTVLFRNLPMKMRQPIKNNRTLIGRRRDKGCRLVDPDGLG